MQPVPLFDRLGGRQGIASLVNRIMAKHMENATVKTRFKHATQSVEQLTDHAIEFFCTGLSGVESYRGRPLAQAHAGMNISERRFLVDEAMGSVVGFVRFGPNLIPDTHLFRLEDGKIRYVHTLTVCPDSGCAFN